MHKIGGVSLIFNKKTAVVNFKKKSSLQKEILKHYELYIFILPALIALIIFSYVPMYGVLMAFQDVKIGHAFLFGNWVGLRHFQRFFNGGWFSIIFSNTIKLSLANNFLCLPLPIILALLMHNCVSKRIKKISQTATYLPHLLSIVVVVSILNVFCAGEAGLINILLKKFGMSQISFFGSPKWVIPLYVISGIWASTGYSAIIYLAALSTVDNELVEASMIDGAGKLRQVWHIQIPSILTTIVIMLILNLGHMFGVGADKMLLLQTNLNLSASEIISTYVYKTGYINAQYGFSTAVGIFQNVINLVLLLFVNYTSKKLSDISMF
jgi:putative aldouronate transport system permease protein